MQQSFRKMWLLFVLTLCRFIDTIGNKEFLTKARATKWLTFIFITIL